MRKSERDRKKETKKSGFSKCPMKIFIEKHTDILISYSKKL